VRPVLLPNCSHDCGRRSVAAASRAAVVNVALAALITWGRSAGGPRRPGTVVQRPDHGGLVRRPSVRPAAAACRTDEHDDHDEHDDCRRPRILGTKVRGRGLLTTGDDCFYTSFKQSREKFGLCSGKVREKSEAVGSRRSRAGCMQATPYYYLYGASGIHSSRVRHRQGKVCQGAGFKILNTYARGVT
jgi:hypothetical protein